MSRITTVLLAAVVLLLAYLVLSWFVDGYFGGAIFPNSVERDSWEPPSTWADWRDVVIVLTAFFWLIGGLAMTALMIALLFLVLTLRRMLKENVAPAVDSLKASLDNVRGTTEFAGETVASPLIRAYSVVRGVRGGIAALGSLPDAIKNRRNPKKKKRR